MDTRGAIFMRGGKIGPNLRLKKLSIIRMSLMKPKLRGPKYSDFAFLVAGMSIE